MSAPPEPNETDQSECPVCNKPFPTDTIEVHVNRCIFLNTEDSNQAKGSCQPPSEASGSASKETKRRMFGLFDNRSPKEIKKPKLESNSKRKLGLGNSGRNSRSPPAEESSVIDIDDENSEDEDCEEVKKSSVRESASSSCAGTIPKNSLSSKSSFLYSKSPATTSLPKTNNGNSKTTNGQSVKDETVEKSIPLAEKMRPESIEDYCGQTHILGDNTILRKVLEKNEVPSMILWGPPGCGKTTLAHIIAKRCKQTQNVRFVKLSATMVGVNDVKEVVKVAKNEQKFQRKTILFMDEIHRFNKLQQDIFLPHVESGSITLIGATTENPSFSLNSALLSRCRVIILEKLDSSHMFSILRRSLRAFDAITFDVENGDPVPDLDELGFVPKVMVERASIQWLADMCDGDARIALNSLQLAMQSILDEPQNGDQVGRMRVVSLDAIKEGVKKSHFLYDRKGDQHYDMISALHKSIRASDDNAALYWCTRMMCGGEDPRYICRRLVRAASEDIGLADPQAIAIALSALNAVQLVGMPEADCIIAQCAVYLARAPKSTETYVAMKRCQRDINECKGPQPGVPLHLRNAPTKLMKEIGYGAGYNMSHRDESGLQYMPEGLEDRDYFRLD